MDKKRKSCLKLKQENKKWQVYLPKITIRTLMIAPTTTTHPATTVMILGIPGIVKTSSIIPEPTASDTNIPTTHARIPAIPFAIFTSFFYFFFFLFACEMEKYHC